jgi:hypothetical protein
MRITHIPTAVPPPPPLRPPWQETYVRVYCRVDHPAAVEGLQAAVSEWCAAHSHVTNPTPFTPGRREAAPAAAGRGAGGGRPAKRMRVGGGGGGGNGGDGDQGPAAGAAHRVASLGASAGVPLTEGAEVEAGDGEGDSDA